MKKIALFAGIALVAVGMLGSIFIASAMTPTLSLYSSGNSDAVQATVNGDSYASVTLYYQKSGYGLQSWYMGSTNSSGYLSTSLSMSNLGVVSGSNAYVMINNQQSTSVSWPYGSYTGGPISLSQSNINLSVSQTTTVTIYGGYAPYSMYPSGSNIFQSVISGNIINLWGLNTGSGTLNVCSSGGSPCTTLYVTVSAGYNNNPIYYGIATPVTFSQTSATLSVGQSKTVSIYGGSLGSYYNNYYIGYNSNSSGVSATVSGSNLTVTGLSTTASVIVVCSSSSSCGAFTVAVGQTQTGSNWTYCASENQQCYVPGTQQIRYGASGQYAYRTVSGYVSCSNSVFGDPIFGIVKQCYYGGAIY